MVVSAKMLGSHRAFAHLSESDLAALGCCFRPRRLARGELVFRQGEAGDTLMIVEAGLLSVMVRGADGRQRVVNEAGAGAVLGEMACVDPSPRSATVIARTDATVFVLSRDALGALRAHAPALATVVYDVILRAVLTRLGSVNAQLVERVGPATRPVSGVAPRSAVAEGAATGLRAWVRSLAS